MAKDRLDISSRVWSKSGVLALVMFDMSGFAALNLLAGVIELSVPSYGLRLVRRFGTRQVGWFIVAAFLSLALLHLVLSTRPAPAVPAAVVGLRPEIIYILGCALLLIGMAHLETVYSQRAIADVKQRSELSRTLVELKSQLQAVTQANGELQREASGYVARIRTLTELELRYRSLFEHNPLPMWVVDLRSGGFLAVNEAAFRQYGFNKDEFNALRISDLVPVSAATATLRDLAQPCTSAASVRIWQHRRKDGSLIGAQITALDLVFGDRPGRLMVAEELGVLR